MGEWTLGTTDTIALQERFLHRTERIAVNNKQTIRTLRKRIADQDRDARTIHNLRATVAGYHKRVVALQKHVHDLQVANHRLIDRRYR